MRPAPAPGRGGRRTQGGPLGAVSRGGHRAVAERAGLSQPDSGLEGPNLSRAGSRDNAGPLRPEVFGNPFRGRRLRPRAGPIRLVLFAGDTGIIYEYVYGKGAI